jgi:7,8-dihydropterin-6-yl-methyl-4-(beta-D-ribofuranosyl)aminobenzene 5'-phosphate synthase
VRVTTLIDNLRSPDDPQLEAEWGLSLCVESSGRQILVDMGASDAFARNAERLSVDLAAIDVAILSHHHYDHGGGLRRFLELNDHAPIYLGATPDGDPTVKLLGFVRKYIGLDPALLASHSHRFRFVHERTEVLPGVVVLPCIGGQHALPAGNRFLFLKRDSGLVPDDFRHEIIVAIHEHNALVVLTACSHNGLLNMVEAASAEFPGIPVRAVIGGFHLAKLPPFRGMTESERAVADIGRAILDLRIETTYTGHCTGKAAFEVLHRAMGDRLQEIHTGSRVTL